MATKTLTRGKDETAIVEVGSQAEAEMKAIGFEDPAEDGKKAKDAKPEPDGKKAKDAK